MVVMGGSLPGTKSQRMSSLSDKEFQILTQLSVSPEVISQRKLAKQTRVSVGLVNAVLRNLIHRGYVKAKALNKKQMQYLLTPKGIVQIMRRSYHSVINTICSYNQLEHKIDSVILDLIEQGHEKFYLYGGSGELAKFVRMCLRKNFKNSNHQILKKITGEKPGLVILNLTESSPQVEGKIINFLEHLRIDAVTSQLS